MAVRADRQVMRRVPGLAGDGAGLVQAAKKRFSRPVSAEIRLLPGLQEICRRSRPCQAFSRESAQTARVWSILMT